MATASTPLVATTTEAYETLALQIEALKKASFEFDKERAVALNEIYGKFLADWDAEVAKFGTANTETKTTLQNMRINVGSYKQSIEFILREKFNVNPPAPVVAPMPGLAPSPSI